MQTRVMKNIHVQITYSCQNGNAELLEARSALLS